MSSTSASGMTTVSSTRAGSAGSTEPPTSSTSSPTDLTLEQLVTLYRSGKLNPQSQMYLQIVMEEMPNLHLRKAAGYGQKKDTWANFRGSRRIGVPTLKAVWIRLQDKVSRAENLLFDPNNDQIGEGLERELPDLAAYAVIDLCILREETSAAGKKDA
jgi:hypothetical protein